MIREYPACGKQRMVHDGQRVVAMIGVKGTVLTSSQVVEGTVEECAAEAVKLGLAMPEPVEVPVPVAKIPAWSAPLVSAVAEAQKE